MALRRFRKQRCLIRRRGVDRNVIQPALEPLKIGELVSYPLFGPLDISFSTTRRARMVVDDRYWVAESSSDGMSEVVNQDNSETVLRGQEKQW